MTTKTRCQRIGCDATFSPDDNNDDNTCCYHPGPLFHDGGKQWSCCKQRSHDFGLFLSIPGCARGRHTSEKPQTKAAPSPNSKLPSDCAHLSCSRCKQGFFCSEHGKKLASAPAAKQPQQPPAMQPKQDSVKETASAVTKTVTAPRVIDLDAQRTCRNKGCGKVFTERENSETACSYHPGPAVFHDRSRGWACCNMHVKEFDEFLTIPPCAKGWHNSD